jgi:hypothetical protein
MVIVISILPKITQKQHFKNEIKEPCLARYPLSSL